MSRRPQTCVDCAKRKIRCNKVIPCDVCQKRHVLVIDTLMFILTLTMYRGTAHTCRRADITDTQAINKQRAQRSTSPGLANLQSPTQGGPLGEPAWNERLLSLVSTLSDRVQKLESKIDGAQM